MQELVTEYQFADVIASEEELRAIIGTPLQRAVDKVNSKLDKICRDFIGRSPFVLVASCDAHGNMDISPKGDPGGFVQVLDDRTLLIPDRPGNRRADTFTNVLQNPNVALFFVVPGKQETLRVVGRARVVRDEELRSGLAVRGKMPDLLLAVHVQEVFFHCAKCIIRSRLWDAAAPDDLPSMAEIMVRHAKLTVPVDALEAEIAESYRTRLY